MRAIGRMRLRAVTAGIAITLLCLYAHAYFRSSSGPLYFGPTETDAQVRYSVSYGDVIFWPISWLDRAVIRPSAWMRPPCMLAPIPAPLRVSQDRPQRKEMAPRDGEWSNMLAIVRQGIVRQEEKVADLRDAARARRGCSNGGAASLAKEEGMLNELKILEREVLDLNVAGHREMPGAERQFREKDSAGKRPLDE